MTFNLTYIGSSFERFSPTSAPDCVGSVPMPNARMLQCLAFSLPQTFIAPNYESKLGGPLQTQMHFTDTSSDCGDPDFLSRVKTVYGASVSSGSPFSISTVFSNSNSQDAPHFLDSVLIQFFLDLTPPSGNVTLVKRGGLSNPFCSLSWISTTVQTPGPYILDYNNPVCGSNAPNLTDFSDNMSLILGIADVDSDGNISFQGGNYSDVFSGAYGLDNSAVTYQMESDAAFRIWVSSNQASLSADNSCVYKYLAWQRSISFHKFTLVRYSIGEQTLLDGMDIEDGCIKHATSYELGLFNFDNQEGKNCGNPDPKSRFKRYFGDDADLSYGLLDLADGLFQIFVGETKRRDESYPATFHYFDETFSQTLATTTAMDTTVTAATETTIYTASTTSSINTVSDISAVSTSDDSTVSTISTIESNGPNSTATTTSAIEIPKSSISTESSTLDATITVVSTLSSSASATSDNLQISSTIDFTATTVTDFQSASESTAPTSIPTTSLSGTSSTVDTDIASIRSQSVSLNSFTGLTATTTSFMTFAFSTCSSPDQVTKTQSFTQSTSSILSRPVDSSQTDALSLRSTVTQLETLSSKPTITTTTTTTTVFFNTSVNTTSASFTSTTRTATSSKIPSSVSTTACIINNPSQEVQMIASGPIPSVTPVKNYALELTTAISDLQMSLPGYLAQLNAVFSASTFQIIDGLPLSSPVIFSGAPLSQGANAVVVLILSENFKFTGNSGVGYDNNKCNSAISVNAFSVQTNVIGFSYVLDETVTSEWFSLQVSNDQSRLTVNVYTEHQAIATFEFSLSARNTRASIDTEFVVVNGVGSVIQPLKIVSTSISNSGLPTTAATQTPSTSTVLKPQSTQFHLNVNSGSFVAGNFIGPLLLLILVCF